MAKLTQNKLAGMIATKENGLSQAKVGDVNQVIKILKKMLVDELEEKFHTKERMEIYEILMLEAHKKGYVFETSKFHTNEELAAKWAKTAEKLEEKTKSKKIAKKKKK